MRLLLDVNVLLSLGASTHNFHKRTNLWIQSLKADDVLLTCSITELGFVRILSQPSTYDIDVTSAIQFLKELKTEATIRFEFLPDPHGATDLPAWVDTSKKTTDGHLLALAQAHGAELVTYDTGIPGAYPIP